MDQTEFVNIETPTVTGKKDKIVETNSKKNKYGLPTAVSLVVGIMIGSGIFLKNKDVIENTHSVALSLFSWILGGIGVLCAALALIEIISVKTKDNNDGIISWASAMVGRKFSNIVAWFFLIIYVPIIYATLACYAANFTAKSFHYGEHNWIFQFGLSVIFFSYFVIVNALWNKPGRLFQFWLTVCKLIPLFVIILVGLLSLHSAKHIFDPVTNDTGHPLKANYGGILLALPGILFAFDGFYYVANTRRDMKNPKKTLPRAIIIGITFAALFYALFSIAIFSINGLEHRNIAHGAGSADHYADLTFASWFAKFINYTVILATLVGLNGYTIVGSRIIKSCSARFDLKWNKVVQKETKSGAPLGAGIFGYISGMIFLVGALLIGMVYAKAKGDYATDGFVKIIDFLSNWETIIMLFMISVVFLFGIINRFKNRVGVEKKWYFIPTAVVAILFFVIVPTSNIVMRAIWAWGPDNATDHAKALQNQILMYILFGFLLFTMIGMWIKNHPNFIDDKNKKEIKVLEDKNKKNINKKT